MKSRHLLTLSLIGVGSFFVACEEKANRDVQEEYPVPSEVLPRVLGENRADLIKSRLKNEAILKSTLHQLPNNPEEWAAYRIKLRENIIKAGGIDVDHDLPLDLRETKTIQMDGYSIKNIYFQTHPGIYATANLFIPNGEGPFPAVIGVHGHWREGKLDESVQSIGHTLAKNGYVALIMDAFGSGERTTVHGDFEYHGANLGTSLLNVGETLLGMQVTDNMRAVDLLQALPYVDSENIGVTGASGGGNQAMWFAALDERVKAAVPIVSVGTFESAVMGSNCVCELLPDGLKFTETAGVLALYAPRALKMCNHEQDSNPTFYPSEMLRSYHNAKPVFQMLGVEKHIGYEIFNLSHGYWPENREVMLGWFDLHLKGVGDGTSKKEIPFKTLPQEELMVFELGKRDPLVLTIEEFTKKRGKELKHEFLDADRQDGDQLRDELRSVLRIDQTAGSLSPHVMGKEGGWNKVVLQTQEGKLIPLLVNPPKNSSGDFTVLTHTMGKDSISASIWQRLLKEGNGVVIVELSGTGEASSATDTAVEHLSSFHTLARAELWLGKSMLGEWVKELEQVTTFLRDTYDTSKLNFDGSREAALAGLFLNALEEDVFQKLTLREAPLSYIFDNREQIDAYSMGIHLPGFLNWGDVSLAAALGSGDVEFVTPLSMSGEQLPGSQLEEFQSEFDELTKQLTYSGEISISK